MIQIRRNHVPRTICAVAAASAVLSLAAPLRAQEKDSDFIDTRVTFVFADDNVFAGPRDRSPNIDFGQRNEANTFFDNYDTKDSGQETKSNLVLYKAFGGPFPRIVGDAGLVSRFDFYLDEETGKPGAGFFDDGTFLQLSYLLCDTSGTPSELSKAKNRLYLLAFPFNADRMRLGYSYDITWGGNPTFPNNTRGVPGLKLGWDGDRAYAFVGAKSARLLNEKTNDLQSNFGLLAGAGYDLTDLLRWEVGGGFFQKGVFPPNSLTDPIGGKDVQAEGVSTQLTYHVGMPIETSVDLRLYRNDPSFPWRAFREEKPAEDWAYMAAGEFTVLNQNLRDPDHSGDTTLQQAYAGDINLRVKKGFLRLTLDFVYRDVAYILFNVPSFTPYTGFPDSSKTRPEWFTAVGADYYLPDWRVNFGLIAGYQRPATFRGDWKIDNVSTVVVRREGDFEILPLDQKAYDILSLRGFTRWDATDGLGLLAEVTYTLDKNASKLVRAEDGTLYRDFDKKRVQNQLAFAFIMQARF